MKVFTLSSLLCLAFFSCSSEKKETISTDIVSLKKHIQLDHEPLNAQWSIINKGTEDSRVPGPSDYYLLATLRYSLADVAKIRNEILRKDTAVKETYLDTTFIRSWFPESVKKQFYRKDEYLKVSGAVYSSAVFDRTPFSSGFCFFTKDGYVFLCINTL